MEVERSTMCRRPPWARRLPQALVPDDFLPREQAGTNRSRALRSEPPGHQGEGKTPTSVASHSAPTSQHSSHTGGAREAHDNGDASAISEPDLVNSRRKACLDQRP